MTRSSERPLPPTAPMHMPWHPRALRGDVACADTASAMVLQYAMGPSYGAPDPFDPQAGRIVNVSSLPLGARSLVVSGDDTTLVAIGAHTVMAVDLTTSTPLSGSVVAGRRRVMIAGSTELAGPRRSPARHLNPGGSDTAWSLRSMLTMQYHRRSALAVPAWVLRPPRFQRSGRCLA